MVLQKQPKFGKFLDSVYDFGRNNKNKKWFKEAISEMGLKEKWITKDQSNNRLVKILLFFALLLLIIANILLVKCYKNSLEMKKPNWIINNDKGSVLIHSRDRGIAYNFSQARQGLLQRWTEHSTLIFENLKPVEISKNIFNII